MTTLTLEELDELERQMAIEPLASGCDFVDAAFTKSNVTCKQLIAAARKGIEATDQAYIIEELQRRLKILGENCETYRRAAYPDEDWEDDTASPTQRAIDKARKSTPQKPEPSGEQCPDCGEFYENISSCDCGASEGDAPNPRADLVRRFNEWTPGKPSPSGSVEGLVKRWDTISSPGHSISEIYEAGDALAKALKQLASKIDELRSTSEHNYRKGLEHHQEAIALSLEVGRYKQEKDALRTALHAMTGTAKEFADERDRLSEALASYAKGDSVWFNHDKGCCARNALAGGAE